MLPAVSGVIKVSRRKTLRIGFSKLEEVTENKFEQNHVFTKSVGDNTNRVRLAVVLGLDIYFDVIP